MIRLNGIERSYESRAGKAYVLRDVNLEVDPGEFLTVMGPSGSGKTTLLNIIGMMDDSWNGELFFLNQPVHKLARKERSELNKKYIGFVFQSYHLIDNLTVYENLDVPLSYRNVKSSERASLVCDMLNRFQIAGKQDLFPNQLSGGQQQIVAIARALIGKPKVILADEPTGNLHSKQGTEVMELFRKLNQEGTTIIQVTHSERNAGYSHRVIELLDGQVFQ